MNTFSDRWRHEKLTADREILIPVRLVLLQVGAYLNYFGNFSLVPG